VWVGETAQVTWIEVIAVKDKQHQPVVYDMQYRYNEQPKTRRI